MVKAIWKGEVLAESEQTIIVEGNHYFPPGSINRNFFQDSESHSICGWKGLASYYNVVVDGATNKDAAWYYPEPSEAAKKIAGYVAFWHGVQVGEV
jgi:uncharacterized protein (DUF427 family)